MVVVNFDRLVLAPSNVGNFAFFSLANRCENLASSERTPRCGGAAAEFPAGVIIPPRMVMMSSRGVCNQQREDAAVLPLDFWLG